jgi:DNA-binding transcriptional LysR family regulator
MHATRRGPVAGDFDWALVRSFVAVADHGTLSAAARAIGLSQPTLGRHVADLEQQLGTPLFERTGRGLAMTERARALLPMARQMDEQADAIRRAASGADASLAGTVRVTASQPVACVLLPPVLARLRRRHPEIQVELVSTNAVTNLLRREADIALRMVRPTQASLITKRLPDVRVVACAHRDYLARAGTPARVQDVAGHEIIVGDRQHDIERGVASMGLHADSVAYALRTDDFLAQWAAVRAGMGIGFVASYVARTDPSIVVILPSLPLPRLPLWLTVHREIHGNARIRAVFDFLADHVTRSLSVAPPSRARI